MANRKCRERDIEEYLASLQDGSISEDEADIMDVNEFDYYPTSVDLIRELEGASDLTESDDEEPTSFSSDSGENDSPNVDPVKPAAIKKPGIRELVWRKDNLIYDEDRVKFTGDLEPYKRTTAIQTPFQFFSFFMTDNILMKIVFETNLYIVQKEIAHCQPVTLLEIRKFLGILIFMSVYHYPNVRSYWSEHGFRTIMESMTLNRFEKIRSVIHFNDNDLHKPVGHPDHDRLHKIRPFIDHMNNAFSSTTPFEQRLSLDEQMCATKIGHFMKQYLPNKPHKWGFKLYVLCSLSGYAYRFEIYSGKQEHVRLSEEPDLGSVGNTVVRLCRPLHRNVNHILYFDNYYTTLPLLHYLSTQGIHALGTIQRNRLGKHCNLPSQKDFNKTSVKRGTYEEQLTDYEGVPISVTCWKDNKLVTLASTYVGAKPEGTIRRFDKKNKKQTSIVCPKIIKEYNAHMGGVDLMDSFLGRYRIKMKSRKWYIRLFYHLLDMAIINSWVLYKQSNEGKELKTLSLADFRTDLADSLCKYGPSGAHKRGRPSKLETLLVTKKRRCPKHYVPSKVVRTDGRDHYEQRCNKKTRCKLPGCKGFSRIQCSKCKVALCHTKERNCFLTFHT